MQFQQKESSIKVISYFKKVFQIIISQLIFIIKPITKQYQEMGIITFIMHYFLSIIKIALFTLIQIAKFYLKRVPFIITVPKKNEDHSVLRILIVS